MRVTLIHNPSAGDGNQPDRDELVRLIRTAGHTVAYQSSHDEQWATVLDQRADLIAVAGGDGTIAQVAKLMLGRRIPLAALPTGTANNICRSLGLVDVSFDQQIAGWQAARRVPLDIGIATGPWGMSHFVEGFGIGLFALMIPQADASTTLSEMVHADAKLDYAWEMLAEQARSFPAVQLQASLDGKDISGRYVLFEAMNMLFVGPNLNFAPQGHPGDGRLDVVLVSETEREKLREYFSCGQECKHRPPDLPSYQGRHLQIEWNGFDLHIDDQAWPNGNPVAAASNLIEVRVQSNCLELLLPGPNRIAPVHCNLI